MARSASLKKRSDKLRNTLTDQMLGVTSVEDPPSAPQETQGHMDTEHVNGDSEKEKDTYQSDWAKRMQEDLRRAANSAGDKDRNQDRHTEQRDRQFERREQKEQQQRQQDKGEEIPDRWEEREELPVEWEELQPRRQQVRVRKPVVITKWFGFESETDASETDENEWQEVDKKKRKEEKRKQLKRKRKEMECLTSTKASCMIGIGPINETLMEELRVDRVSFEDAKMIVARDFLENRLEFDRVDVDEMRIMETKLSSKDDGILYLAMKTQDHCKEIHIRRTEIQDDTIIVRNYIPPNMYKRFMHLQSICRDARSEDAELKTQLRFGRKDIELFTKRKGENEPFRQIKLEDFTKEEIPPFDHNVRWKHMTDKPRRRHIRPTNRRNAENPARRQDYGKTPEVEKTSGPEQARPLVRQSSINSNRDKKKLKMSSRLSEDEKMESGSDSGSDSSGSGSGSEDQAGTEQELINDK